MEDAEADAVTLYSGGAAMTPSISLMSGIAQRFRNGAVVQVTSLDQAKIAENAGAACLLVSDHPACALRRMPDPDLVRSIKREASIPVMVSVRAGHFVEAQVMEALGSVDYIDESEVLGVADEGNFVTKHNYRCPFVCGCRGLGEALRRVSEGAVMIRAQGETVSETVKSVRAVMGELRVLINMDNDEVFAFAKRIAAPFDLVCQTKQMGSLPFVLFAAGGITTPADVALMMQLGCEGVFIGNEVFECSDPYKKLRGIVRAASHYIDPYILGECSAGLD